jgi:hypothetical protein
MLLAPVSPQCLTKLTPVLLLQTGSEVGHAIAACSSSVASSAVATTASAIAAGRATISTTAAAAAAGVAVRTSSRS